MAAAPKYVGYDGPEDETSLVKALTDLLNQTVQETIDGITAKDMLIGQIVSIAVARGYTKRLGFAAWIGVHIGYGATHCNECKRVYEKRRVLPAALAWYREGNLPYQPQRLKGPKFALEIISAYERRYDPAERIKRRGKTSKELRAEVMLWRDRFEKVGDELRKIAQYADVEPRVLNAIEREIEAEDAEVEFPVETEMDEPQTEKPKPETSGGQTEQHRSAQADEEEDEPDEELTIGDWIERANQSGSIDEHIKATEIVWGKISGGRMKPDERRIAQENRAALQALLDDDHAGVIAKISGIHKPSIWHSIDRSKLALQGLYAALVNKRGTMSGKDANEVEELIDELVIAVSERAAKRRQ